MWSDPFVPHPAPCPKYPVPINKENLQRIFGNAGDFTLREVLAGPEGNVVCAGSLYLIGEMRTVLREERDKR